MAKKSKQTQKAAKPRKKRVLSKSTKHITPGKKQATAAKIPAKKVIPVYKSGKKAGQQRPVKKNIQKDAISKKQAKSATSKAMSSKDNLFYYNKLKKKIAEWYKENTGDDHINRVFLENKTNNTWTQLKAIDNGNINPSIFKGFVNNLDQFIQKPTRTIIDKDNLVDTEKSIDWWMIDEYFKNNPAYLSKFKSIQVDMEGMIGKNEKWETNDAKDLDLKDIRRQVFKLVSRMKTDKNYYAFFHIIESADGESVIFELTELPGENNLTKDEIEVPELEEEEEEEPGKGGKGKGKKGIGHQERPKEKKEKEEKISPSEKAKIEREARKDELGILIMKRDSFEKSISFNNKQIREIADVIKVLKEIKVDYSNEKEQIVSMQAANKKLYASIDTINTKIENL